MSFKVMADNNQSISASQDGAMYNAFAGNKDFIIAGIGNEMVVGHNATSRVVSLGTGEAIVCGRHITAQGTNNLTLPASSSGYLCLRYDASSNEIASIVATSTIRNENLNNGGSVRDMVLGEYTTNSTGVTSYTDRRDVQSSAVVENATYAETAGVATKWTGIRWGINDPTDDIGNDGDVYYVIEG